MVIGVVAAGLGLFVLAVIAKHIMAGLGLLAAFHWLQKLAVFGSGGAQLGLWLLLAATFAAVFLLLVLGLLPRITAEGRERNRRRVRTPGGPTSWSSGWTAVRLDPDIEAPDADSPEDTRPTS
jgi:hypothetical protein